MVIDDNVLYQNLKDLNIIDNKLLDEAYAMSQKEKKPLSDIILGKDLITDENLGKEIADIIKTSFVRLSEVSIPQEILKIIPEVVAKKQKIIAFKKDKEGLHLAMANPHDLEVVDFTKKKTGLPVIIYYATQKDINNALAFYKKDIQMAFDEIVNENVKKITGNNHAEPSIIKIVDIIMDYAYENKASDIHIEPQENQTLVRFRIDGILHDIIKLPFDLHEMIVSRIKVMAGLRIDEHYSPQDGKLQFKSDQELVDIRTSIVPITSGEKIVMRLLSARSRQYALDDLGINDTDLNKIRNAYTKPYGMILATGPTGSGKTTTLYTILKLLNKREINMMTIEDPVEYDIEGVNQIQVNPKASLNFASGLRSIVRQDPDIVLVGEIRDEETADIAINSAMTGHLVLSTLHTNNAATAIPRLFDMKVEPYLVASTVNVIIGQRLVRKICGKCRVSLEIKSDEKKSNPLTAGLSKALLDRLFNKKTTIRIYYGKGCQVCHNTGYEGRVGIFEVLEVNNEIRKAIVEKKDAGVLAVLAEKEGMIPMIEDGIEKVKNGVTTIEEVIRVTKE